MSRHVNEFDWNAEAVERLRQMCEQGYSGGQIALIMGLSRNAVCGKIERLGLVRAYPSEVVKLAPTVAQPAGRSRAKPRSEWKKREPRKPKEQHQSLPTLAEPVKPRALPAHEPSTLTAVTTGELQSQHCRWPLNDGKPEWLHCGAMACDGPYCPDHRARAFSGGTRSERAAA